METATRDPEVFVTQQVAALAAGFQDKDMGLHRALLPREGEGGSGYVTAHYLRALANPSSKPEPYLMESGS